jgi:hypothetical protein
MLWQQSGAASIRPSSYEIFFFQFSSQDLQPTDSLFSLSVQVWIPAKSFMQDNLNPRTLTYAHQLNTGICSVHSALVLMRAIA